MLSVRGIGKSYGPVRALQDVSANFAPAEIHALLGENGAGKSTLMHVMSGFAMPDMGTVELDGAGIPLGKPAECKKRGIAMIHQHFTLVPAFSVGENLVLSQLAGMGRIDAASLTSSALRQAQELGWKIEPDACTGKLSVGAQQRLEILKALSANANAIIFDEPTAVLAPDEVEDLFRVLRRLKVEGKIVILIAHKLREVMAIADRVTVLRKGKCVATAAIDEVDASQLAEMMVGEMPPPLSWNPTHASAKVLELRDVHLSGERGEVALDGLGFSVSRGEVLGVGGVDGNGQQELAELLAGLRKPNSGTVAWKESGNPKIAYIPQDRQTDGLAQSMTIEENLFISGHRRGDLRAGPFLRKKNISEWSVGLIDRFSIQGSAQTIVSTLSGGNQQKVVVARSLDQTPDLLIAVNPTRGLDLKATRYVHERILEARDNGAAVVLISTDLDELAAIASKTVYLFRGKIVEGAGPLALLGGA